MDPRHTLFKTLDKLSVDPETTGNMSAPTSDAAASNPASSGVTPEAIERKLRETLGAEYVEIADLSGKSSLYNYTKQNKILCSNFMLRVMNTDVFTLEDLADAQRRRVRADVRSHYCFTTIHQENNTGTTPTRQCST